MFSSRADGCQAKNKCGHLYSQCFEVLMPVPRGHRSSFRLVGVVVFAQKRRRDTSKRNTSAEQQSCRSCAYLRLNRSTRSSPRPQFPSNQIKLLNSVSEPFRGRKGADARFCRENLLGACSCLGGHRISHRPSFSKPVYVFCTAQPV